MPTLNQFRLGLEALQSIKTRHYWEPIIIPQWQQQHSLSNAWNGGIQTAINKSADFIFVINDDVLFAPFVIDALVGEFLQPFHKDPKDHIVMITACNKHDELNLDPKQILTYANRGISQLSIADSPDFSAFMIRPDFFDICGEFDENFNPAYFEDNDMHRRISLLGYRAICTTAAPYFHYGSRTQNANPDSPVSNSEKFLACMKYYRDKWGGNVGNEQFDHPFNNDSLSPKEWLRG